jgi:hypothetical protein
MRRAPIDAQLRPARYGPTRPTALDAQLQFRPFVVETTGASRPHDGKEARSPPVSHVLLLSA